VPQEFNGFLPLFFGFSYIHSPNTLIRKGIKESKEGCSDFCFAESGPIGHPFNTLSNIFTITVSHLQKQLLASQQGLFRDSIVMNYNEI